MGWFTAVVLYVLVWWVSLFLVLPFGTRPSAAPDPASGWRGTPAGAGLWRKMLWTTLIATVVWGALEAVIASDWLSFREGLLALPKD